MAEEWTSMPNTEHLREPWDEWEDEPLLSVKPHRQDFETATRIGGGLSLTDIKPGVLVTLSVNFRMLERSYSDRVFHLAAVTDDNVLIQQGLPPDQVKGQPCSHLN